LRRIEFSRPVRAGVKDGLVTQDTTVLDYGCGHGSDLDLLQAQGIDSSGWDPAFRPDEPLRETDVVNLGYVINVIEDPNERLQALKKAWELCRKLLVVSAQVKVYDSGTSQVPYGDGVITQRNTFQKFYEQDELKEYIETVLETEALPAAPGIFYVFREESLRQQFVANRFRRRAATPRLKVSEVLFEKHKDILEPFMQVIAELGRLPTEEEFLDAPAVKRELGSLKRAFGIIKRVTGGEEWEAIAQKRSEDLLVYLALARFRKRPRFSGLPPGIQNDVKAFLGTYTRACDIADELLFSVGDIDAVDRACNDVGVGKLLPDALYVHRSTLDVLSPLLRMYEGCGRAYLGEIEGANIIKLGRSEPEISYLSYPEFEKDPHPAIAGSVKLSLRSLRVKYTDYTEYRNPPILHRKETFVTEEHPMHAKFAKLTRQEEKHGLLENAAAIGTRDRWAERLAYAGFELRGHRLARKKG